MKKINWKAAVLILVVSLAITSCLCSTGSSADGDTYYFTDTDVSWDSGQFGILISMLMFIFFFYTGYRSDKRSGGAFLLLSGFLFLSFDFTLTSYIDPVAVYPLVTPFAVFIMLLGIRKFWYTMEGDDLKGEGKR